MSEVSRCCVLAKTRRVPSRETQGSKSAPSSANVTRATFVVAGSDSPLAFAGCAVLAWTRVAGALAAWVSVVAPVVVQPARRAGRRSAVQRVRRVQRVMSGLRRGGRATPRRGSARRRARKARSDRVSSPAHADSAATRGDVCHLSDRHTGRLERPARAPESIGRSGGVVQSGAQAAAEKGRWRKWWLRLGSRSVARRAGDDRGRTAVADPAGAGAALLAAGREVVEVVREVPLVEAGQELGGGGLVQLEDAVHELLPCKADLPLFGLDLNQEFSLLGITAARPQHPPLPVVLNT